MRSAILLAAVLALASVASAAVCPGAPDTGCEDFGKLLVLEEPGAICPVENMNANCSKIKGLQTDFQNIFDAWIEADMCNITALENAAAEASRSLAEVWSGALGSVRCEGQGVMCGFTPSDLSDWATRLQEIFALESFVFQSESRVFCYGDLRQLSSVLASAVAPTADDVCTTGGTVQDFENRYQAAIQPEIELALKRAVAKRCKLRQEFRSTSACVLEIDGKSAKAGSVCGGASDMSPCSGAGRRKCCLPGFNLAICTCTKCNGPWKRRSKANDELRIFADRSGTKCYCGNSVFFRRNRS